MRSAFWISAIILGGAACSAEVDTEQLGDIVALDGDAAAGETAYVDLCERCHGPGGDGDGRGQALNGGGYTAEALVETMLSGPGTMPSFADEADQDLADIAAYILDLGAAE